MARFRNTLDVDVIYTDGVRAFITPDGWGGYWGEGAGDDAVEDIKEHYEWLHVEYVDEEEMDRIQNDA